MAATSGNLAIGSDISPVSLNLHSSLPAFAADTNFEPNFRQFDFFLEDKDVPSVSVAERVLHSGEGETHWSFRNFLSTNARCTPVLVTSIFGAAFCNFFYTRLINKSGTSVRWSFVKFYACMVIWNNFTKFYARERYFRRDFQRNQMYSVDEMRDQRDRQRIREALFEKQFVTNPVAEYRIKAWQVADRFA